MKDGQRVYVIERGPGYCKIGVSDNFERRKKQIEMQGGFRASNSYVTDGLDNAFEVENTVHRQFAEFRKIGEWFSVPFEKAVSAVAQTAKAIGKTRVEYAHEPKVAVSGLTDKERELLDKITALFPKLTEPEKERTIAFIEGMAFKASLQNAQSAAPRPTA